MSSIYTEATLVVWDQKYVKAVIAEFMVFALLIVVILIWELVKDVDLLSPENEENTGELSAIKVPSDSPGELQMGEHGNKYEIGDNNELPDPYGNQNNSDQKFEFDGNQGENNENIEDNNPYEPYNPQNGNKMAVTGNYQGTGKAGLADECRMSLREELFIHLVYHAVPVGYCIITQLGIVIVLLCWLHMVFLVLYIVFRFMEKPAAKWMLIGTGIINLFLVFWGMCNWNKSEI